MELMCKLKSYGINGPLLNWFNGYISERRQKVVIGGCGSKYCKVLSGVPQGLILGLLLFALYINDVVKLIPVDVKNKCIVLL